jgi:hypothetical protein
MLFQAGFYYSGRNTLQAEFVGRVHHPHPPARATRPANDEPALRIRRVHLVMVPAPQDDHRLRVHQELTPRFPRVMRVQGLAARVVAELARVANQRLQPEHEGNVFGHHGQTFLGDRA